MNKLSLKTPSIVVAFLSIFSNNIFAHDYKTANHPDDHAPIGVMRDHVHKKGEFMASYRLNYMKMKGLKSGDNKADKTATFKKYNLSPNEMSVKMHMLGAMYGLTNKLTLAAMATAAEKVMNNDKKTGGNLKTRTAEIGDTKLNSLYEFYNKNERRAQLNLGISLPTSSYNEKHNVTQLPYAMQIGSGSYEFLPGLSYAGHNSEFSYGAQINAIFRLDANDRGYKLGDAYNATTWIAKKLNKSFSVSTRLDYNKKEAIEGVDKVLNVNLIPTADRSLYNSQRLDALLGANFVVQRGFLKGNRFAVEFGAPLYERVDGPMLETDYKLTAGWENAF